MNNALTHQIEERDVIIMKMQKRDSLIDSLLISERTDTTSMIVFLRNEHGNIISYQELDSLYMFYKRQNDIQDFIIRTTKQKFHYDYRIAQHGDTLLLDVWDKKYTVQSEEFIDFNHE
jgi:hypothetical protein